MAATFGILDLPPSPPTAPFVNVTVCGAGIKGEPEVWTYVMGVMLGIMASLGINIGNNVQSLGLTKQAKAGETRHNKLFWMGTGTFIIASVINFAAFGLAPAAVLAPLESVQFVSNLLFARFVNHVNVTRRMVGGSALIICGTILAIAFGPSRVLQFTVDDLISFWGNADWLLYLTLNLALAFSTQIIHVVYERAKEAGRHLRWSSTVLPVTFGLSSALAGSYCVVQAKCMSELFEIFLNEPTCILSHWFFYVTLILLFVCLYIWISRLNMALTKYDPLFIIPLLQSNYILFSTLTGGVFFREFSQLNATGWACFVTGICIMFLGLFLLAPSEHPSEGGNKVAPEMQHIEHSDPDAADLDAVDGTASATSKSSRRSEVVQDIHAAGLMAVAPDLDAAKLESADPCELEDGVSSFHRPQPVDTTTPVCLDGTESLPSSPTKPSEALERAGNSAPPSEASLSSSVRGAGNPSSLCTSASSNVSTSLSRPPSAQVLELASRQTPAVGAVGAVVMMRSATPAMQQYASRRVGGFRCSREIPDSMLSPSASSRDCSSQTPPSGPSRSGRASRRSSRCGMNQTPTMAARIDEEHDNSSHDKVTAGSFKGSGLQMGEDPAPPTPSASASFKKPLQIF